MKGLTPHQRTKGKAYAETSRCRGGSLCLDLCNTGQGYRSPRETEWISSFADLVDWLEASSAITQSQAARFRQAAEKHPGSAAEVWARAIRFREALFRVLGAHAGNKVAAREDLACIETEHARAQPFARLAWNGDAYAWSLDPAASALEAVLQPVADSAVQLLGSDRLARLRRCGNVTCFWLFLDETRNRSRRWCEMASCGNLLKVRRHRERVRQHAH